MVKKSDFLYFYIMSSSQLHAFKILLLISFGFQVSIAQRSSKDPRFIEGIQIQTIGADKSSVNFKKKGNAPAISIATEYCTKLHFKYAQLLNVEVEKLGDRVMLEYFEKWVNENGLNDHYRTSRVDQFGFAGVLMQDVYNWGVPESMDAQLNAYHKINKSDLQFGDMVFFGKKGKPQKTAVYLADGQIADLNEKQEIQVRALDEKYYRKNFITGCRPSDVGVSR